MSRLDELFGLGGKTAVVVGGAGHLCSVLVSAFLDCGMNIALLDVAERPESSFQLPPDRVLALRCDVTSKKELAQARETVLARFKKIDVLLNGAGNNAPTPFLEISEQEVQRIVGLNLTGTLLGCQVFGEAMLRQRSGSIINFTSVSAGPPLSKAFVYSAAKAGVANLTQSLAREWAPHNVRVNALKPGFFPTEWSMKNFIDEDRKSRILNHTPMRRFGEPGELIGAVLWLASDAASFVTGSIVTVDGGFTAMTI